MTFDSYEKGSDGFRFSEYEGNEDSKYKIPYNDGITEDHVMASASVPVNYSMSSLRTQAIPHTIIGTEGGLVIHHFAS